MLSKNDEKILKNLKVLYIEDEERYFEICLYGA